jgi:hypothetical protein
MILSMFCRHCDRKFRLEFPTPDLRKTQELGFRDMNDRIRALKENVICEQWRGQPGVKLSIE